MGANSRISVLVFTGFALIIANCQSQSRPVDSLRSPPPTTSTILPPDICDCNGHRAIDSGHVAFNGIVAQAIDEFPFPIQVKSSIGQVDESLYLYSSVELSFPYRADAYGATVTEAKDRFHQGQVDELQLSSIKRDYKFFADAFSSENCKFPVTVSVSNGILAKKDDGKFRAELMNTTSSYREQVEGTSSFSFLFKTCCSREPLFYNDQINSCQENVDVEGLPISGNVSYDLETMINSIMGVVSFPNDTTMEIDLSWTEPNAR